MGKLTNPLGDYNPNDPSTWGGAGANAAPPQSADAALNNPYPATDPGFTSIGVGPETGFMQNNQVPPQQNNVGAGSKVAPNGGFDPSKYSDATSAFNAFVNGNPQYAGGGQAAIDAFGAADPAYKGIVAWDPRRSIYELPGGYDTNLPGGTGGWSFTGTQPEGGGGGGQQQFDPTQFASLFGNVPSPQQNDPNAGEVGTDPFSQLLEGGYGAVIGNGGAPLTKFGQSTENTLNQTLNNPLTTPAFESARGGFQAADDAMTNQIMGDLANRGMASMPGVRSGEQFASQNRMLETLAPIFDQSIGNSENSMYQTALGDATQMTQNESNNLLQGLNGGANYQQTISNIALNTLKENDAFNEFAATFGLNKDIAAYEIANGQNTQMLNLFAQYLATLNTSAQGTVG